MENLTCRDVWMGGLKLHLVGGEVVVIVPRDDDELHALIEAHRTESRQVFNLLPLDTWAENGQPQWTGRGRLLVRAGSINAIEFQVPPHPPAAEQ